MTKRQKKCVKFVLDLLEMEDFNLYIDKWEDWDKVFKLEDVQCWNLWDIESDEFLNLWSVIDRLDTYHWDYIYEELNSSEDRLDELSEYAVYLESDRVADTLLKITPEMIENDEEFSNPYVLNLN